MPKLWWKPTSPFMADYVPWRHAAGVGVIRNHDHSLMRTYAMRGPDLLGLSHESQGAVMQAMNNAFQKLPGHWSLHFEQQRCAVTEYPEAQWPHPVLAWIDAHQRRELRDGPTFESRYYLTIRRQPLKPMATRLGEALMTRPATPRQTAGLPPEVDEFREHADHFAWLLRGVLAVCEPLRGEALLTYLHSCVSDRWHHVGYPRSVADLNWKLCDARMEGGWEPRLGHWHLGLCSVLLFPDKSMAPLLAQLDHLPFGHRRVTRWIAWHRQTARGVFRRAENVWLSLEKGPLNEALGAAGHETRVIDSHATNQAMDADAARQEVSGAYVAYGNFTTTVLVWGQSPTQADQRIRAVQQIFEDEGFNAIVESEHSAPAFRSMLPGDVKSSVRRKPLSSLNVAHLAPGLKAVWPGSVRDDHLQAAPWFLAKTEGSTLFRVVNHYLDIGHSLVLGPTGCHASGTLILMYNGTLKAVEDIVVGDQLMGPDSLPRRVLRLHRGRDQMVKVIPQKGEPFIVNMGHMLSLRRTGDGTTKAGSIEDISVQEWMRKSRTYKHTHKLYRAGVEFVFRRDLPINPYLLGVLLGDGNLAHTTTFTSADREIVRRLQAISGRGGFDIYATGKIRGHTTLYRIGRDKNSPRARDHFRCYSRIGHALRRLKLLPIRCEDKFIPQAYKTSGKSQRLKLLAGLLDTDGSLDRNCYDFVSKSRQLAHDVVFVARSLGFAAYIKPCLKSCQTGATGEYYRVSISGETDIIPCAIRRKQATPRQQKKNVRMTGFTINPIGIDDYYGFECDRDHRYLMGDFTVTHNSGKSVLLAFMAAQWCRYPQAQVFLFDVGRSARALTLCVGGRYHEIGADGLGFQPFARIDDEHERAWVLEWTLRLLTQEHVPLTEVVHRYVSGALRELAKRPVAERTLTGLLGVMVERPAELELMRPKQSDLRNAMDLERSGVRRALEEYTAAGSYGGLLNASADDLQSGWWHTFELGTLLELPRLAPAVLSYLFHRLQQRFQGQPTLLISDETALVLGLPEFEAKIKEYMRTLRKVNVSVILSVHSIADVFESPLGDLLLESCPTRYVLPNTAALEPRLARIYSEMGFGPEEQRVIATGRGQADYYFQNPLGRRRLQLRLSGIPYAICGASRMEDHRLMDAILAEGHGEDFARVFLARKGCPVPEVEKELVDAAD